MSCFFCGSPAAMIESENTVPCSYCDDIGKENLTVKIINPVEEINRAIPELSTITNYGNTEYLSSQNFDSRLKRIETNNLKVYGRSTSWVSMGTWFNPCIIEIRDNKTLVINKEKYKLIAAYMKTTHMQEKIKMKSA